MKENQFELPERCLSDIQERDEKINRKNADIMKLLDEHNVRFAKVRKDYVYLGWPGKEEGEKSRVLAYDIFNNELRSIDMFYDRLTHSSDADEEPGKKLELTENYISDLFTITRERWNTIHIAREKLRTDRADLIGRELQLYESFNILIKQKEQTESLDWHKKANAIPDEHLILIVSLEKLITEEEVLLNEMELIIGLREKLYKIVCKTAGN